MAHGDNGLSSKDSAIGVAATIIIVFISIALYNVLELNFIIFSTFNRRSGLYFCSFLVATWGIALNAIGYLLKSLALTNISNLYVTLIIIGWCTMVTGQSVVLYSRLHLVMQNPTVLRFVLAMIIFNAIALHIPVIVLVYGANSANPSPFVGPYSVYEKLQLTVFFVQESIISGLYIWQTTKLLKVERDIRGRAGPRRVMIHLIYVNVIVMLLDITILALEFANYYDVQTGYKPLVYSIKLKLEFSILNRLVELTRSSAHSSSVTPSRADVTAGVEWDTSATDCAGGSRGIVQRKRSDEAHITDGGGSKSLKRSATAVERGAEVIMLDDRPGRGHQDRESLDGGSRMTIESVASEEGRASTAASEIQFIRAGFDD